MFQCSLHPVLSRLIHQYLASFSVRSIVSFSNRLQSPCSGKVFRAVTVPFPLIKQLMTRATLGHMNQQMVWKCDNFFLAASVSRAFLHILLRVANGTQKIVGLQWSITWFGLWIQMSKQSFGRLTPLFYSSQRYGYCVRGTSHKQTNQSIIDLPDEPGIGRRKWQALIDILELENGEIFTHRRLRYPRELLRQRLIIQEFISWRLLQLGPWHYCSWVAHSRTDCVRMWCVLGDS